MIQETLVEIKSELSNAIEMKCVYESSSNMLAQARVNK
jgi:hypothetical protein